MKMDKEMIDRVLDNSASSVESKATMDWFATEEGQEYLSQRITAESVLMGEREIEEWTGGNIPTERMRKRFLGQIKQHSRLWRWWQVAAVFIPFLLFGSTIVFLADKAGVFSDIQYAEIVVPCGERMQVVLQDGTNVELNSATTLRYPKKFGLFSRKVELYIIRKSKFPQNPKRSVRFSGKRTKRSVQKRKARNTQKAETKVL